ncbi:hypothetical protein ABW19_dt0205464 [Dactylella cylindrospora]|nr:hypothetical protein ABW19_dt0205464 [Dactylella cylindrospora]
MRTRRQTPIDDAATNSDEPLQHQPARPATPPLPPTLFSALTAAGSIWRNAISDAHRLSLTQPPIALLTPENGYSLTSTLVYTDPDPVLESLFIEASSCRTSHPAIEVRVDVWNWIPSVQPNKGNDVHSGSISSADLNIDTRNGGPAKCGSRDNVNGLYPPYQLGIAHDDGVLTIHRAYKSEDLAASSRKAYFSEILFSVWVSPMSAGEQKMKVEMGKVKLKWVLIPEVNNVECKMVVRYAYETLGLDTRKDMLVLDRDANDARLTELWDAILGTPTVKVASYPSSPFNRTN